MHKGHYRSKISCGEPVNLKEIEDLHRLGFAIHWLKPRTKVPCLPKWSQTPKQPWPALLKAFRPGFNVGVNLGVHSKIPGGYLAVLDLDVKSKNPVHEQEARAKLQELFPDVAYCPKVRSGRGNGSAHYYVKVETPISGGEILARSKKLCKVLMPSQPTSTRDADLIPGYHRRPCWEISLLSHGRQVVLPPSRHPDTGKNYFWARPVKPDLSNIPLFKKPVVNTKEIRPSETDFSPVDLDGLGLNPKHVAMIKTGEEVEDRSAALFSVCLGMVSRNVPDQTILSVLTDRVYFLGQTAFDHAKTGDRLKAANWIQKYCLAKAKQKIEEENLTGALPFDVVEDWQKKLAFTPGPKGAPPKIKASFFNALLILSNVVGSDLLKENTFSGETFWGLDTPWGFHAGKKRSSSNEDSVQVKKWFWEQFELDFTTQMIEEVLVWFATQNRFHPVQAFLSTLVWDGVPRVENAFNYYLGADGMPKLYLRAVSRKFFIGMIKRIYEPGAKVDSFPVLEGAQGVGKSSFGRILVGDEWFLDGLPDLGDKDAALNLQGSWLCEMSELSSLYRSEIETAKAFISRQVDRVRPPYGRRRINLPRQTVFLGTTNKSDFLIDTTGNRRFWPLQVSGLLFRKLEQDRGQLLAEAKFLYDFDPEPLYLTGKVKRIADELRSTKRAETEADLFADMLGPYFEKNPPGEQFRLISLFENGPLIGTARNMKNIRDVAEALRGLGYEKQHIETGNFWVKARRLECL